MKLHSLKYKSWRFHLHPAPAHCPQIRKIYILCGQYYYYSVRR